MRLEGGCLCRKVRYRVEGTPYDETVCHCTMCRRASGAPMVAWFTVPIGALRWSGEPARYRSSARVTRSFCASCGSALAFQRDELPGEIDLTMATLDDPGLVPPRDHTRTSGQLPWVVLGDGLPRFREAREPEPPRGQPPSGPPDTRDPSQ